MKSFELLRTLNVIGWVRGNTDDWVNEIEDDYVPKNDIEKYIYDKYLFATKQMTKEAIALIKALPETQEINIGEYSILCAHGSDRSIREPIGIMTSENDISALIKRLKQDILLCGHTHSPYIVSCDNKLIMNVGSIGNPSDDEKSTYGVLELSNETFAFGKRKVILHTKE